MDEQTTTDAVVQDQAQETAQLEEQPAEAVTTTDSELTTNDAETGVEEPGTPDNSEDDLSDYWTKKGIDISTPEGQLASAKSYREAEKMATRKSQERSELAKQLGEQPVAVDSDNPLVIELANKVHSMERKDSVSSFISEHKLTSEQDVAMGSWLQSNPEKVQLINAGYMTLGDAYKLSGVGEKDTSDIERQGGQKALEKLANKQRAAAPSGSAVSTNRTSTGNSLSDLEERLADVKF